MRNKKIYILAVLLLMVLTACGKKEVVFDEEEITGNGETIAEGESDGTLKGSLGIGDEWKWKENIQVNNDTVAIKAEIKLPDVAEMYTMEVSKHYYDAEDKKKTAEYFFDADSIKVDLEEVPTKENIKADIEKCNTMIEAESQTDISDENKIALLSSEKKRLEALVNEAPDTNDMEEAPGDYSQNYYRGTRDGVEYKLEFDIDETRNLSAWTLQVEEEDIDKFNSRGTGEVGWNSYAVIGDNICSMTEEQAGQEAVKICKGLGLPAMKVSAIHDINWFYMDGESELNGYEIILSRDINGVAVDAEEYSDYDYLDVESVEKPYDIERVIVQLNDSGIISMTYEGILTEGKLSNSVKLLDFDQIKEIIREKVVEKNHEEFLWLELNYVRVLNEKDENTYSYIPAWRLGAWEESTDLKGNLWINAMDGSVINLKETGAAQYITVDDVISEYDLENYESD